MQQFIYYGIGIYILIINLSGYVMMGADKKRAEQKKWRIRERTLFLIAALGGSVGVILGMKKFRHKTKHASFVFGIPAILIFQIIVIYTITYKIVK